MIYDAGSSDANEYHDNGIGKVEPPKVKLYTIVLNNIQSLIRIF